MAINGRDPFKRASQSIVLNIAEGSSRTSIKDKVNFARVSKGSVFECAAFVDLALEFELLPMCPVRTITVPSHLLVGLALGRVDQIAGWIIVKTWYGGNC